MIYKIFPIFLTLLIAPFVFAQLCVDWLPVYLCPGECFEIQVCHEPLNPGFVYDSIYVYTGLTGTGVWYNISIDPPDTPVICNGAYWSAVLNNWVFGWDSVYILAESSGVVAAETSFLVFNYPPDSAWVTDSVISPSYSETLFVKYLNVMGAMLWRWLTDTMIIRNNFSHSAIIDTSVCVTPDHQKYTGPDSLNPSLIDTLFDPCPDAVCKSFRLLPTDVVSGEIWVCPNICDTFLINATYPYSHIWIWNGETLAVSSHTVDTLVFCNVPCDTSWARYFANLAGNWVLIDSIPVISPCLRYAVTMECQCPRDLADTFCTGDTVRICLDSLSQALDTTQVRWITTDGIFYGICTYIVADLSMWVKFQISDDFACQYNDSVFVNVYEKQSFTIEHRGGCAGSPVLFWLEADTIPTGIVVYSFGDGNWASALSSDTISYTYGAPGNFKVIARLTTPYGCESAESVWVRQSVVSASLSVQPNPVCKGGQVILDASASTAVPSSQLVYRFYDNHDSLIQSSISSFVIDTVDTSGIWKVWVVDTTTSCSSFAMIDVNAMWADIFVPETIHAVLGCPASLTLMGIGNNCSELIYGYRPYNPDSGIFGNLTVLPANIFSTAPVIDTVYYWLYVWCLHCPGSKDSAMIVVIPIKIVAQAHDSALCYGDYIPNLLDSFSVSPSNMTDSIMCQVILRCGVSDVVLLDWCSPSLIPTTFSYPVLNDCLLLYRFAPIGSYDCYYEAVGRISTRHPVAVLNISPDDTLCSGTVASLDATLSYANCEGINLCYSYYQIIGETMVPLTEEYCTLSFNYWRLPYSLSPGTYTFAVRVCMEDVDWCCDTARATLVVCEPIAPQVQVVSGECAPGIVQEGNTLSLRVDNAYQFDRFCWYTDGSLPPPCHGIDSMFSFIVPDDSAVTVNLCAYRCGDACTTCVQKNFLINHSPQFVSLYFAATEDVPLDTALTVIEPDSDAFYCSLINGPTGLIVTPDCRINWNSPTNCYVNTTFVSIAVTDSSVCRATDTAIVIIDVRNTFSGISMLDTLFGMSCLDSLSFTRDTIRFFNRGDYCYDISLALRGDDQYQCDCGFRTAGTYRWLNVNSSSGIITADVSDVPGDVPYRTYYETVFYSDCHLTDTFYVVVYVPNHSPRLARTIPPSVMIPKSTESVAASLDWFFDPDSQNIAWNNVSITKADSYQITLSNPELRLLPLGQYMNFPGIPDTLIFNVEDIYGASIETQMLVWVYDPEIVYPETRKPVSTAIVGAYPNPFNGSVLIEFELLETEDISLMIFDITGHSVRTLARGIAPAGTFKILWDGKDETHQEVPSGAYFSVLKTPEQVYSIKLWLVR